MVAVIKKNVTFALNKSLPEIRVYLRVIYKSE
jgi:hypothetical protein